MRREGKNTLNWKNLLAFIVVNTAGRHFRPRKHPTRPLRLERERERDVFSSRELAASRPSNSV